MGNVALGRYPVDSHGCYQRNLSLQARLGRRPLPLDGGKSPFGGELPELRRDLFLGSCKNKRPKNPWDVMGCQNQLF